MTEEQRIRYSRLIAIQEIGEEGVRRLNQSSVLVVGCGALGSMAAMQLAASGVGHLRIVDFDTIDLSNLQRQLFFHTEETGKSKAETLALRIHSINPEICVETNRTMLSETNARQLIQGCDFIVEATDNSASMNLVDRLSNEMGINCVLAGVSDFSGQVMTCLPGSRRYSDIFQQIEDGGGLPCALTGVAGPAAALAASVEAAEAIKSIAGLPPLLSDSMLIFNLLDLTFEIIKT